ncbi:MAG: TolC family protein, partial [Butyricicoccus sp.]|nr:TolC family protein [Butyricicoccus sp.]
AIDDLEDMIDYLEAEVDGFEALSDNIEDSMGALSQLDAVPGLAALIPYQTALGAGTIASLQSQIATLKVQIGQLEDQIETLENTDYEPYERQFENIEDQIVMGAQTAYIGLATMQQNYVLLLQQIDLLGIKVNEMKTRYKMGQVSDLDVAEVEAAKLEADSGLETLKLSVRNTKGDLNLLLGRPASQGFLLDGLPELDTAQLAALNLERDLASGKRASYDIYKAEQALEDAKDLDKSDDGRKNKIRAAEYTLSSTEQSFEQSFRKLFRDVAEKNRLVTVARQNQTLEARKLAVAETKYNRGMISRNDLIEAQLDKAKVDTDVKLAQVNLFAAYMQYEWAVKGVLSSASAAMK